MSKSQHLAYPVRVEIVRAFVCSIAERIYGNRALSYTEYILANDPEVDLLRVLLSVTECDVLKAIRSDRVGF